MRPNTLVSAIVVAGAIAQASCARMGDQDVFTLYRNSVTDVNARYHIATFDSREGSSYNRENCQRASTLFESQPGVSVRYWCEQGKYRP